MSPKFGTAFLALHRLSTGESFTIIKTLGHYQIASQIGKGGMGEMSQAKGSASAYRLSLYQRH